MTSRSTNRRQLKKLQAKLALEQRIKDSLANDENLRNGFTAADREVDEQQEALDLFRAFLADEFA